MKKGPSVVLVSVPNVSMLEPRIGPPLGCIYLVAWARKKGWDTSDWKVIDHNVECYQPDAPVGHWTHDFSLERCMREIPTGADIYGVQLSSMQMAHGVAVAKLLREREPQAKIICGGSHASAMPDECTEWFDIVIEREGEKAFETVLHRVAGHESLTPFERPSKHGHRGTIITGTPVDPLDELPFPARDMLDFSRYTRKIAGERASNIISSRGCPARCRFCMQSSLWSDKPMRVHSSERILAEVDHIRETTGIQNLLFLDDSLTARKKSEMIVLCEGLAKRGVKWRGWTRANLICRKGQGEILQLMADSGCQAICVGVEGGSDKVLKAMDKGTTVAQNEEALKRVAESGMSARCSIMVGSPQETWDDVQALVDFIERMRFWVTDWILSSYVPLPGTPDWDNPDHGGFVIDKKKARDTLYRHFYVVGGLESSGLVHSYTNGLGPDDIQMRHDYVQESLIRLAPRDRIAVTIGLQAEGVLVDGTSGHDQAVAVVQ